MLALVFLGLGSSSCLPIPHRHLKRPEITFLVRDHLGHAIPGARLTLFSGIVVGQSIRERVVVPLDSRGLGHIEREREWHWFFLAVPDGEAPWVWAWCVDAPGYRRAAEQLTHQPEDTVRISLSQEARGRPCAPEPRSLYDVNAEGAR